MVALKRWVEDAMEDVRCSLRTFARVRMLRATDGAAAVGCLLALGGCAEPSARVEVEGVVLDARTGGPIEGARVSTDDGWATKTDARGRFALSVAQRESVRLTARAESHAHASMDWQPFREPRAHVVFRLMPMNEPVVSLAHDAAPPLTADHGGPPELHLPNEAALQPDACVNCHDVGLRDEWSTSSMSELSQAVEADQPALRDGCAECHDGRAFVARHEGLRAQPTADPPVAITCGACHDGHASKRAFGLRVDDTSEPVAGRRIHHLGSGALCVSCHRGGIARSLEPDAAPHAPQADVLVGRGARLVEATDEGSHRHIAGTCARCHMVQLAEDHPEQGTAGGHTFAVRGRSGRVTEGVCAPCHGPTDPASLSARDWNGDGLAGALLREYTQAFADVVRRFRRRISHARVTDTCVPRRSAVDVVEHDARMHLVASDGRMLGDCDGDGRFSDGEAAVTSQELSPFLADIAYDVMLLRQDGSRGAHNPPFAFHVLRGLARELR